MKIIIKKNKTKPCIDENRKFAKFFKLANKLIWLYRLVIWIFDKFPFYYYAKIELPKSSNLFN